MPGSPVDGDDSVAAVAELEVTTPLAEEPVDAPVVEARRVSGLAPFESMAYRYLFVGTALTMTGNFMQQVAQGWLIYDLTDSPTWLGVGVIVSRSPIGAARSTLVTKPATSGNFASAGAIVTSSP